MRIVEWPSQNSCNIWEDVIDLENPMSVPYLPTSDSVKIPKYILTWLQIIFFRVHYWRSEKQENAHLICHDIAAFLRVLQGEKEEPSSFVGLRIILMYSTMVLFEETANYLSCAHCAHSPDTWQDCKAPEPRMSHWNLKEMRQFAGRFIVTFSGEDTEIAQ